MKAHVPGGNQDPYLEAYRAVLKRQHARLRAELAEVKASQLTRGGRWMRNLLVGLVIAVVGIVAAGVLLVYVVNSHQ